MGSATLPACTDPNWCRSPIRSGAARRRPRHSSRRSAWRCGADGLQGRVAEQNRTVSMAWTPMSSSAPPLRRPARGFGEPSPRRAPARVHAVAAGLGDLAQLAARDPRLHARTYLVVEAPAVRHHQLPAGRRRGPVHGTRPRPACGPSASPPAHAQAIVRGACGAGQLGVPRRWRRCPGRRPARSAGGRGDAVPLGQRPQRCLTPVRGRPPARRRGARARPGVEVHDPTGAEQGDAHRGDLQHPSIKSRWARLEEDHDHGQHQIQEAAAIVRFQFRRGRGCGTTTAPPDCLGVLVGEGGR